MQNESAGSPVDLTRPDCEGMQGVCTQISADFLERMIGGHELIAVGKSIHTHKDHVWRAANEDVNFGCAGFLQVVDASFAGRPSNNGVIYYDDSLAFHELSMRFSFTRNVEIAINCEVAGTAANIMISTKAISKGIPDSSESQRGAIAAVRAGTTRSAL